MQFVKYVSKEFSLCATLSRKLSVIPSIGSNVRFTTF